MKIIYTFLWGWAPLPVITACENESGGAGNFHVTEAWCILRLRADCSSDEHYVESCACACDNSPSLTRPLSFLVIDAFCINAIHWCVYWLFIGMGATRLLSCVCVCVCEVEGGYLIQKQKQNQGDERGDHLECFLSTAVQKSWSKVNRVRGGICMCDYDTWADIYQTLCASSVGTRRIAGCGGEEPKWQKEREMSRPDINGVLKGG